jgi:hypothetical protein
MEKQSKDKLTFIYQNFIKEILVTVECMRMVELDAVVELANSKMRHFLSGTAAKYAFRAGSKIHEGSNSQESEIIDLKKREFYLREERAIEGNPLSVAYPVLPDLVGYLPEHKKRITGLFRKSYNEQGTI